jgi:hypothetical protein
VTGAAERIAEALVEVVGGSSPYLLLLGVFVLTAEFGQLISNMATALIVIPIALSAASELGLSARPVLMCVTVAAAASFLTPVATPVNLMVMGPGGYRFGDYWKLGLPLLVAVPGRGHLPRPAPLAVLTSAIEAECMTTFREGDAAGEDGEVPYVSTGHLPSPAQVQRGVDEAHKRYRSVAEGHNATVYPALARVPSDLFGVCAVGTSGNLYAAGDAGYRFTIMSVASRSSSPSSARRSALTRPGTSWA